ncbi:mCG147248 [Mus musculus]|nr:mCG147248 [Mus musculus]
MNRGLQTVGRSGESVEGRVPQALLHNIPDWCILDYGNKERIDNCHSHFYTSLRHGKPLDKDQVPKQEPHLKDNSIIPGLCFITRYENHQVNI